MKWLKLFGALLLCGLFGALAEGVMSWAIGFNSTLVSVIAAACLMAWLVVVYDPRERRNPS